MPKELRLRTAFGKTVSDKNELLSVWASGRDFFSVYTRYCSIRDIEQLKKEYDYIYICSLNKTKDKLIETLIYTSILAGITSYA
jgi:hypothetical protein